MPSYGNIPYGGGGVGPSAAGGLFSGFLSTFIPGFQANIDRNRKIAEEESEQQQRIYKLLLESPTATDEDRAIGMTGLMERGKTDFFGRAKKSPTYGKALDLFKKMRAMEEEKNPFAIEAQQGSEPSPSPMGGVNAPSYGTGPQSPLTTSIASSGDQGGATTAQMMMQQMAEQGGTQGLPGQEGMPPMGAEAPAPPEGPMAQPAEPMVSPQGQAFPGSVPPQPGMLPGAAPVQPEVLPPGEAEAAFGLPSPSPEALASPIGQMLPKPPTPPKAPEETPGATGISAAKSYKEAWDVLTAMEKGRVEARRLPDPAIEKQKSLLKSLYGAGMSWKDAQRAIPREMLPGAFASQDAIEKQQMAQEFKARLEESKASNARQIAQMRIDADSEKIDKQIEAAMARVKVTEKGKSGRVAAAQAGRPAKEHPAIDAYRREYLQRGREAKRISAQQTFRAASDHAKGILDDDAYKAELARIKAEIEGIMDIDESEIPGLEEALSAAPAATATIPGKTSKGGVKILSVRDDK